MFILKLGISDYDVPGDNDCVCDCVCDYDVPGDKTERILSVRSSPRAAERN